MSRTLLHSRNDDLGHPRKKSETTEVARGHRLDNYFSNKPEVSERDCLLQNGWVFAEWPRVRSRQLRRMIWFLLSGA
jgi:hypothetical protein